MAVVITGASDDLIEVDGDINEEFGATEVADDAGETGGVLGFSNGVVLRVRYDEDGIWRITPITGADKVTVVQAPVDDDDHYTDVATLEGARWVVFGTAWAGAK